MNVAAKQTTAEWFLEEVTDRKRRLAFLENRWAVLTGTVRVLTKEVRALTKENLHLRAQLRDVNGQIRDMGDRLEALEDAERTAAEGWLTIAEASDELSVSTHTIREYIREGIIGARKFKGTWRVDARSVRAFVGV